MQPIPRQALTALLLAGGQGSRLGGRDKGLMLWHGEPIAPQLLRLVRPLVSEALISCNRHQAQYQAWADRLVNDATTDYPGPLAGILSGLQACRTTHLLVLPCDLPHLNQALIEALLAQAARTPDQPCLIKTGDNWQPLLTVIPCACLAALEAAWSDGQRSPLRWLLSQSHQYLELPATDKRLHNANTAEDWV
ncbi:MAG: molybdenum cofactor guanylyltransferase MobA [Gammaproteobacteria bacterium HGW-Gammaproteobacteria-11]|nr:MAG: molybdenum cofactor guanylyltransferase MobA [Gammaproteobacteria bacterium HGW-Gammaproteobacteria-11]